MNILSQVLGQRTLRRVIVVTAGVILFEVLNGFAEVTDRAYQIGAWLRSLIFGPGE